MINKKKNVNLQLTINKKAFERFINIQTDISEKTGLDLSKSQVIEYLINNYKLNGLTETNNNRENAERDREEYMKKIIALKTSLNMSYKRLGEILNIPIACMKNYGTGKQTPNEKNKIKIDEMLKKYNIKI